jgi:hypothetical protein
MYVDNPVFKEILWEWRAFASEFDPDICSNILNLPLKDGKSTKMLDRYICRLGYDTNIKIRDKELVKSCVTYMRFLSMENVCRTKIEIA